MMSVIPRMGLAAEAEGRVIVLDGFEAELTKEWYAWGPGAGKIRRVPRPDGAGHCLEWQFAKPADEKKPSGLARKALKCPEGVTQAVGWTFCFSTRGLKPGEGAFYLTINEADRSCWRTVRSANVTWKSDRWTQVRVPLGHLTYAWGNKAREGSEFDVTQLASLTLALRKGSRSTILLDDFRLEGRERPGEIIATLLQPDFTTPPLNAYGGAASLSEGTPPTVREITPATGPPSCVILRGDGVALVNGKPFLPLGVFCVQREDFGEIAEAGFNTVLNYRGFHKQGKAVREYLDLCAAHGMMGVVDVQTFTKTSKSGRAELDGLADLVRRAKDHPALLAWYIADEPEYGKVSADEYVKAYALIKRLDADHPVIMLNNSLAAQAEYAAAGDLLMPDPYPGFFQVEGPRRPLSSQGEYVRECMRVKPNRVWFTPQFHNGFCYGNRNREMGDIKGRAPTLRELRFMIYSAIVHGARGIVAWPHTAAGWSVHDAPEYWRGVKAIVSELRAVAPALTSDDAVNIREAVGPESVKTLARRHEGRLYVFAINDSAVPAKASFALSDTPGPMHAVSEQRQVHVRGGMLEDEFAPWDARVYSSDARTAKTALGELLAGYVEAFSMAGTVHPTRDSNLALYLHGSRATASSTNRWARANAAINGSYATTWRPDAAKEHWLAVDFRRAVTVGKVILVVAAGADGKPYIPEEAYRLELKAGGDWAGVTARRSHFFIHWNPVRNRWERSSKPSAGCRRAIEYRFTPQEVRALRFVSRPSGGRPSVFEIEAYQ